MKLEELEKILSKIDNLLKAVRAANKCLETMNIPNDSYVPDIDGLERALAYLKMEDDYHSREDARVADELATKNDLG